MNQTSRTWESRVLTWIKYPERERRGDSCESSTPKVRGKGTHCNQAPWKWEARGLTWIKHLERERQGDSRESSTPNVRRGDSRELSNPNVRGEEIHVNQALRTWEARGLTWTKHPNGIKFSSRPRHSCWVRL